MSAAVAPAVEHRETFGCFGSECTVIVADTSSVEAAAAVAVARRRLLEWHGRFSRFERDSEINELNADPRRTVPVSPLMRRVVEQCVGAARATGGIVDPTLVSEIELAGYRSHLEPGGLPLCRALELVADRRAARPSLTPAWQSIEVDRRAGTVARPPGVRLDCGGIAKGVFADELAAWLGGYRAFAVDCAGDVRLGGRSGAEREVHVESPFDDSILHTFSLSAGAVATSGIGRRSWIAPDGRPAHHLLDPSSGRPAFTGIVQVTALARTATEAEVLSKAALLRGPAHADEVLAGGGVVVLDDGSFRVF